MTRAARVSVMRAASFFRGAGLYFGAVTTRNANLEPAVPGVTVRSIVDPSPARTSPAGPVTIPAGPEPLGISWPTLKPRSVSSAVTSSTVLPARGGTGRSGSVSGLSLPARSVSLSRNTRGSPTDHGATSASSWSTP